MMEKPAAPKKSMFGNSKANEKDSRNKALKGSLMGMLGQSLKNAGSAAKTNNVSPHSQVTTKPLLSANTLSMAKQKPKGVASSGKGAPSLLKCLDNTQKAVMVAQAKKDGEGLINEVDDVAIL